MSQTPHTDDARPGGMALLCGAGALWSLNGALIKLLYADGVGPHGATIACYRSLIAGVFLLPLALRRRPGFDRWSRLASLRARSGRRSVLGLRAPAVLCTLFFTAMTLAFILANTMTTAANAIILQYTSTFWVFALSPWLLSERAHARDVGLLVVAMVGIAIIFAGNARTDLAGLLVALTSGLFFALLTMLLRQLRDVDSGAMAVMLNLGSGIILLPVVACWGDFALDPREWLLMLTLGIVQFGIPYYLYTLGLARIPAHQAAIATLLEPLLVPIWTYLAVSEVPPAETLLGGAIILVALLLFLRGAGADRRAAPDSTPAA